MLQVPVESWTCTRCPSPFYTLCAGNLHYGASVVAVPGVGGELVDRCASHSQVSSALAPASTSWQLRYLSKMSVIGTVSLEFSPGILPFAGGATTGRETAGGRRHSRRSPLGRCRGW